MLVIILEHSWLTTRDQSNYDWLAASVRSRKLYNTVRPRFNEVAGHRQICPLNRGFVILNLRGTIEMFVISRV